MDTDDSLGTPAAPRIALLPDALANQIAAGEVVERPASVIKELVENALDAESDRIFVEISDSGRSLIRVTDNGAGMVPADATLCIRRHATSKIRETADLMNIGTLGFRGEALPSIASVSRFTLTTRTQDAVAGIRVSIEGGSEPTVDDAASQPGTRIEVRDLFYNVPARLKFLKRRSTEVGHIKSLVTAFALGNPHVHFRLICDGKTTCDHPVTKRLEQRIFQVLGKRTSPRMYPVRLDGEVRVRGFISDPSYVRTNQNGIYAFVNGRHVRDRTITHALISAYGDALERGRFPYAVIYVNLPPSEVDVNVHPAKAEVRFVRTGQVHEAIVRACRLTLSDAPWGLPLAPRSPAGAPGALGLAGHSTSTDRHSPPSPHSIGEGPRTYGAYDASRFPGGAARRVGGQPPPAASGRHQVLDFSQTPGPLNPRQWEVPPPAPRSPAANHLQKGPQQGPHERPHAGQYKGTGARPGSPDSASQGSASQGSAAHENSSRDGAWSLIGSMSDGTLLTERDGDLFIVDPAGARQFLAAATLARALVTGAAPGPKAPRMMPALITLSADQSRRLNTSEANDLLAQLGFDVAEFGGGSWQVRALPRSLAQLSPQLAVESAVAAVADRPHAAAPERHPVILALVAHLRAADRAHAPALLKALAPSLSAQAAAGQRWCLRVDRSRIHQRFGTREERP